MTSTEPAEHELDAPPWRRVEATLMSTSRALRRAYDMRLSPLGLNTSEASVLGLLDEREPMSQVQLANHFGMNKASAGAVIDALQHRGLIERRPDPGDRRVWQVGITAAGRRLAGDVRATDDELRRTLRHGVTRAERQHLANTLLRINANLDAVLRGD